MSEFYAVKESQITNIAIQGLLATCTGSPSSSSVLASIANCGKTLNKYLFLFGGNYSTN
jgi:hypothetical protein